MLETIEWTGAQVDANINTEKQNNCTDFNL